MNFEQNAFSTYESKHPSQCIIFEETSPGEAPSKHLLQLRLSFSYQRPRHRPRVDACFLEHQLFLAQIAVLQGSSLLCLRRPVLYPCRREAAHHVALDQQRLEH